MPRVGELRAVADELPPAFPPQPVFQFNLAVVAEMNQPKSPDVGLAGQLSVLPPGVAGFSLIMEVSVHCLTSECTSP